MVILIKFPKYLAWLALAAACATLATRLGPGKGLAAFALSMAILCVGIAMIVHHQPPQKITLANYMMSFILPWGYRVGRGKLPSIVLTSWTIWVLIGLAIALAINARAHNPEQPPPTGVAADARPAPVEATIATSPPDSSPPDSSPRTIVLMALLALAWLIDGGVLLRCLGLLATSTNRPHLARSLAPLVGVLAGILTASIGLVTLTDSPYAASTALLIAGGPPLVVGIGYGLFVLVFLTAGRNARWN
jgi:hypothetical protein